MKWTEIYKKYKDTDLMGKFVKYVSNHDNYPINADKYYLTDDNIKDIWGYLIVFAETKGYDLRIHHYYKPNGERDYYEASIQHKGWHHNYPNSKAIKEKKDCMDWCTNKFFEVTQ
jgi:hypothetical protein